MYNQFFKLQEKPFSLTPKAGIFHDNEGISPAYRTLIDGVSRGEGAILLTGETGTGKTLCAQRLLAELENNVEYFGISIPFTSLSLDDMLGYICGELNLNFGLGRNENKLEILEVFLTHGVSPIRKIVIVIDEAQNLAPEVFNGLADLLDISKNAQRDVQIVVMSRNESDLKLNHPHMMAFNHQVSLRCHLQNLQSHETASYIKYHLEAAGAVYSDIFTEEAVAKIHELTQGRARAINTLCEQALNVAAVEDETIISIDHINVAHRQHQFDDTIEMSTSMISDAINRMVNERDKKGNTEELEVERPDPEFTKPFLVEEVPETDKFDREIVAFNEDLTAPISLKVEDDLSKTYHNIPIKKSSHGFWKFAITSIAVAVVAWYFLPQIQIQIENLTARDERAAKEQIDQVSEPVVTVLPDNSLSTSTSTSTEAVVERAAKDTLSDDYSTDVLVEDKPIVVQTEQRQILLDDSGDIQETATVIDDLDASSVVYSNEAGEMVQDNILAADVSGADETVSEVEQLFSLARYQISVSQLTSPRNNSALSSYQKILELDPENLQAKEGIEALKEMFLSWAENNKQINKFENAKRYYRKALIIEPENAQALEELANLEGEFPAAEESPEIESGLLELAVGGNSSAIKTLLDKGVYPDIQDQRGNTPLMLATDVGSLRVVNVLLESGANPNLKNKIGETALINAVWKNQIEIADQLIRKNANVNANNNRGWTALMYAAIHGHAELFNKLLDHNANQEAKTEDKKTALTIAAHNGQYGIVNILIHNGARVNGRDKDGWTPLMHAVWNSHAEIVQVLLVSESNINQKNNEGWTPLMMAASNGDRLIAQMLLREGADKSIKNPAGNTAQDLAMDQQHNAVSSLLR